MAYTKPAGGGVGSDEVTAAKAQVLAGYTTVTSDSDDEVVEGTIASKAAATYTPTTSNQTIAAGQYLAGAQTIAGDADLVASNIRNGVNIFNVTGSYGVFPHYASNNWELNGSHTATISIRQSGYYHVCATPVGISAGSWSVYINSTCIVSTTSLWSNFTYYISAGSTLKLTGYYSDGMETFTATKYSD